jgi:large subunit ribosomal protein LP1
LILHDEGIEIKDSSKIATLIKAAGVKIDAFWPKIFFKSIQGKDFSSLLSVSGGSGPAPAQTVA